MLTDSHASWTPQAGSRDQVTPLQLHTVLSP